MTDKPRGPGYRGSLPPRVDRLARVWVVSVVAIFVLILAFAFGGVPSRLIPQPTTGPLPSGPVPSASASASG